MTAHRSESFHFWLGAMGVGIIALHLVLTWRFLGQTDQLILSFLLWSAIASLLWQRRHTLVFQSDRWSMLLGLSLVTLLLCKSLSLLWFESAFVRIFPGWAALCWVLLASGHRFKQYAHEFWIVLTLMVPQGLLAQVIHQLTGNYVQLLIAQTATFLLHYAGVDVVRVGVDVMLGQKAVAVEYACTGMPMLILLIQLAMMLLTLFPVSKVKQLGVLVMAIATALSLSSIRVVVMALAVNHPATFDYWHGSQGSQMFTTIAIGLFILCHHYLTDTDALSNTSQKREV